MANNGATQLPELLQRHESDLLDEWISQQMRVGRRDLKEGELRQQCREFLSLLKSALQNGAVERMDGPEWSELRQMLSTISRSRGAQGFTPTETATFVFSFKNP